MCFQETKMEWISVGIVQDLWGESFMWWTTLPASGASCCIILMWDKRVVECIEEAVSTFSISCKLKYVLD